MANQIQYEYTHKTWGHKYNMAKQMVHVEWRERAQNMHRACTERAKSVQGECTGNAQRLHIACTESAQSVHRECTEHAWSVLGGCMEQVWSSAGGGGWISCCTHTCTGGMRLKRDTCYKVKGFLWPGIMLAEDSKGNRTTIKVRK